MAGPITYKRLDDNLETTLKYFNQLNGNSVADPLNPILKHDEVWLRIFVRTYYKNVTIEQDQREDEGDPVDELGTVLPKRKRMPVNLAPLQNVLGAAEWLARAILENYTISPRDDVNTTHINGYHINGYDHPSRQLQLLQSGDHEAIAKHLPLEIIIQHFGEESPEALAYMRRQVDRYRSLGSTPQEKKAWEAYVNNRIVINGYQIPQLTQNPFGHSGVLQRWIADFCEVNGLKLPKGYWKKDKSQLQGMASGILSTYGIPRDAMILGMRRNAA